MFDILDIFGWNSAKTRGVVSPIVTTHSSEITFFVRSTFCRPQNTQHVFQKAFEFQFRNFWCFQIFHVFCISGWKSTKTRGVVWPITAKINVFLYVAPSTGLKTHNTYFKKCSHFSLGTFDVFRCFMVSVCLSENPRKQEVSSDQ